MKSDSVNRGRFDHFRDPAIRVLWEDFKRTTELEEKVRILLQITQREPLDAKAFVGLAAAYDRLHQPENALMAAREAMLLTGDRADILRTVIRVACKAGKVDVGIRAARRLIDIAPGDADAPLLLAGLYGVAGFDTQSRHWGQYVAECRPLETSSAHGSEKLSIMSLGTIASGSLKYSFPDGKVSSREGHNNLLKLLDRNHITIHRFRVDALNANSDCADNIPPAPVIYNNMADPNQCRDALELAAGLCDRLQECQGSSIINHPRAVLECTREANARRFQDADFLIGPKTIFLGSLVGDIGNLLRETAERHGMRPPLILRAGGYQGGKHMHLIENVDTLNVRLEEKTDVYLIDYCDVSYRDERLPGHLLFPKYRAFLVGDRLFPTHRFVTMDDYKVHRRSSDSLMRQYPWFYHEQQAYLSDPAGHLGEEAWEALRCGLMALGLDYVGCDFAPSSDGEGSLVIFEANAAMRSGYLDKDGADAMIGAYKKVAVAIHELIADKAGVPHWDFKLPPRQDVAPGL